MSSIEIIIIIIIFFIILGFLIKTLSAGRKTRQLLQKATVMIPDSIPSDGVSVPVVESFIGLRGLDAWTFVQNSLNPKFTLFGEYLEYRVIIKRRLNLSDIEKIKGISRKYFNRMRFYFKNKGLTMTVHLFSRESYHVLEDFFKRRGIAVETRD